jgi:hypothetical protein
MELSSCYRSKRQARTAVPGHHWHHGSMQTETLTTVLTTTRANKMPCSAISHNAFRQVSYGMPRSARSLQAGGQGLESPWALLN